MHGLSTLATLAKLGSVARYWYQHSHANIADWARVHGLELRPVCEAIAVLSPGCTVDINARMAREYWAARAAGRPYRVKDSIYAKATTAALAHWEATGEIRGQKTSAFARNLRGDWQAVTLDRHMARVMGCGPDHAKGDSWTRAGIIEATARIERVARRMGWLPCEVQAALWQVGQAEVYGITEVRYLRMFEPAQRALWL